MMPDKRVLPVVRGLCERAAADLAEACRVFRENGWQESAKDLERSLNHLRVWPQPKGFLHYLEQPPADDAEVRDDA